MTMHGLREQSLSCKAKTQVPVSPKHRHRRFISDSWLLCSDNAQKNDDEAASVGSDREDDDDEEEEGVAKPTSEPRQYSDMLQEAYNTDLKHVENLRCVGITGKDLQVISLSSID